MNRDYFLLAIRNLRHRGIRSWLTLIGIFIGIMAVVSLISLGTGLQMAVSSQFGISSTEVITIQAGGISAAGPPGTGISNPLTEGDVRAINRLSVVDIAFPRLISSGKMEFNDIVQFGYSLSVPKGEALKFAYDALELEAEVGRLLKDGDVNKVALGNNFYTNEEIYGKIIRPGDKVLIQDKKFEVVGIVKKKGSFIFDNMVLMNEDPMKDLFGYDDNVDLIIARIQSKELMERAEEDINREMRKIRDVKIGEEDFSVSTPEAMLDTVNSILGGVQIFILIIASISIIVGAIGIVNTMTTSVLERKREIGIMKAIGAKNSHIFFQFLIESGLLGLIGGLIGVIFGVIIGYLGTLGINSFIGAEISPQVDFVLIFSALLGSFLVGSISGIIPAMNAARLNPVEALRG